MHILVRRPLTHVILAVFAAALLAALSGCRSQQEFKTLEVPAADDPILQAERLKFIEQINCAPELEPEVIGTPMKATRGGHLFWVPNPDGETYDIITRYYNTYWGPHTLVAMDLGTGKTYQHKRDNALYSNYCIGPDGKAYVVCTDGDKGPLIEVYDPETNSWSVLSDRPAGLDGETKPLCVGTDKMIYGAGSQDGQAFIYQVNPESGKLTIYSKVGPNHEPNNCWGYSVAADDQYVYVASGKIPWYIVAYNKATGISTLLLTESAPQSHVSVGMARNVQCCTASSRSNGKNAYYWLYHGKLIERKPGSSNPPFPVAKRTPPARPPKPILTLTTPNADGKLDCWYISPSARAKLPRQIPESVDPEKVGWHKISASVPTFTYPVTRLIPLPNGRIIGTGGNYLGNFLYDPATGDARHLGMIHLSEYSGVASNGNVYLSGYPSSALFEYDQEKPWTANTVPTPCRKPIQENAEDANPRRVAYLSHHGSGCHKMMAATSAADGRVYFGGRWYRNGNGGGLGWYEPKTGKAGGLYEPLINYQVKYMTTANQGRYLILSTQAVRGALNNTPCPESAKLFVLDTRTVQPFDLLTGKHRLLKVDPKKTIATGKFVSEIVPVKNALLTGPIVGTNDHCVVGITYNPKERLHGDEQQRLDGIMDNSAIIYKVNIITGKPVWQRIIPFPVGFRTNENAQGKDGFAFIPGPDGYIWTFSGGKMAYFNPAKPWHNSYMGKDLALIRIHPDTGKVSVVGRIDHPGALAFSGNDLIIAGGDRYRTDVNMHLRRLKDIAK